jgi:DNA repair exonuclease SbcCD ATPase subunit
MSMALTLFSQKKELEELHDKIKDAQRDMKHVSRHNAEQKEIVSKLCKEVKAIGSVQKEIVEQLKEATEQMLLASKDFEKAATDIALIRPALEKKMLENFSKTIEQELATTTNKIYAQAAGFNATKDVFKEHIRLSQDAVRELEKFTAISKQLKETDFKLATHTQEIEKNNTEKLRLMKRIDDLERMLAKMKQRK